MALELDWLKKGTKVLTPDGPGEVSFIGRSNGSVKVKVPELGFIEDLSCEEMALDSDFFGVRLVRSHNCFEGRAVGYPYIHFSKQGADLLAVNEWGMEIDISGERVFLILPLEKSFIGKHLGGDFFRRAPYLLIDVSLLGFYRALFEVLSGEGIKEKWENFLAKSSRNTFGHWDIRLRVFFSVINKKLLGHSILFSRQEIVEPIESSALP